MYTHCALWPGMKEKWYRKAERAVIMYVIQYLSYPDWENKWVAGKTKYKTLEEAQAAYDALPIKYGHRIAEEYTVTRYKVVKAKQKK